MSHNRVGTETWANIQANVSMFKDLGLGLSDLFTIEDIKKNSNGTTTTCAQYIDDMEEVHAAKFWEKGLWSLPVGGRVECRKLKTRGRGMFDVDSEIYVLEDVGVIAVFVWNDIETFKKVNEEKHKRPQTSSSHHYDDDDWGAGNNSSMGGNDQYSQAELDNHANQCNPNNAAYHSSRR